MGAGVSVSVSVLSALDGLDDMDGMDGMDGMSGLIGEDWIWMGVCGGDTAVSGPVRGDETLLELG